MLGLDCLQGIFIVHNQKTNLRYSILPNMIKSVKIGNVLFLRYYQDIMIFQDIELDKTALWDPKWEPIVNL